MVSRKWSRFEGVGAWDKYRSGRGNTTKTDGVLFFFTQTPQSTKSKSTSAAAKRKRTSSGSDGRCPRNGQPGTLTATCTQPYISSFVSHISILNSATSKTAPTTMCREGRHGGSDSGGAGGGETGGGGSEGRRWGRREFCRAAARRAPTCPRGAAVGRPARPEPELEERKEQVGVRRRGDGGGERSVFRRWCGGRCCCSVKEGEDLGWCRVEVDCWQCAFTLLLKLSGRSVGSWVWFFVSVACVLALR